MTKLSPSRKISCPPATMNQLKPTPSATNLTSTSPSISSHNTSSSTGNNMVNTPTAFGAISTSTALERDDPSTRDQRSNTSVSTSSNSSRSSCSSASSVVDIGANLHAVPTVSDSISSLSMPSVAAESNNFPSLSCPTANQSGNAGRNPHSGGTPTSSDSGNVSNSAVFVNKSKCTTDVTNGGPNSGSCTPSHHPSLTTGNATVGKLCEDDYHKNASYTAHSNPYGTTAGQRLPNHPSSIPTHSSPVQQTGRHVPTVSSLTAAAGVPSTMGGVSSNLRFDTDLQKARSSVYE